MLEWRMNVPDGTTMPLHSEEAMALGIIVNVVKFLQRAWKMGVSEPKKVMHCVKVGVALTLVSLFYYMRPLYDGVGGNAMWAVMTVVVVFEYTVGATLCKCINRATGTFLAGSLGLGVHWAAHQSGTTFEPIILGFSVFLLASAVTFSRFVPSIKARFDYGAMIFILTFSLVSVSGYRVDKLIDMAHQRLSTIAIGVSLCIMISMFICPIWAGDELHPNRILIYFPLQKHAVWVIAASAVTFSRFVPSIKARFDYGAMIFILTFSLVSVSGYRVDKLIDMAHQRLSTIAIGVSLCIMISMFICPIWAGDELHQLILHNMDKLSLSLEGCVNVYFKEEGCKEDNSTNVTTYKCVFNSKATEETMANFARWEPAHGHYGFRFPWKEYTRIGALMRSCAYCIETLNAFVNTEIQAPKDLNSHHISDACMVLCLRSSDVLKELANCLKSMTKSTKIGHLMGEMNFAVQQLQETLNALPSQLVTNHPSLMEIVPLATMMFVLVEIANRIEGLANGFMEFSDLAEFKAPRNDRATVKIQPIDVAGRAEETSKTYRNTEIQSHL